MRSKKSGFTLAELLIVIAIIAILVSISIPIFVTQKKKAVLAVNQANGRSAFSAAEAAYLDYVAEHGSISANPGSGSYKTATYTYFPATGTGILNFQYTAGSGRWIIDSHGQIDTNTDVSSWTVDTQVSDGRAISYEIARIWTIHLNPENGALVGYYCAFPAANEREYNNVLKVLEAGKEWKPLG